MLLTGFVFKERLKGSASRQIEKFIYGRWSCQNLSESFGVTYWFVLFGDVCKLSKLLHLSAVKHHYVKSIKLLLLHTLGNYREALRFQVGQHITFDREAFIQSRPPNIQPFLEKMLQLQVHII